MLPGDSSTAAQPACWWGRPSAQALASWAPLQLPMRPLRATVCCAWSTWFAVTCVPLAPLARASPSRARTLRPAPGPQILLSPALLPPLFCRQLLPAALLPAQAGGAAAAQVGRPGRGAAGADGDPVWQHGDSLSGFACLHLAPQMLSSVCNRTRGLTNLQGNQLMAN